MALTDEEATAGFEQRRNRGGPPRDAWQPTECADAGEHEVELLTAQGRYRVIDVGLDKLTSSPDLATRAKSHAREPARPSWPG